MSVATAVGFIGLAGVTAEFGIVMLVYLKQAWEERVAAGRGSELSLIEAIREGAVLRVRPKAMTVATTVIGLAPILWETGDGLRDHEPHRRAHGGRHGDRPAHLDVRRARRVAVAAQARGAGAAAAAAKQASHP